MAYKLAWNENKGHEHKESKTEPKKQHPIGKTVGYYTEVVLAIFLISFGIGYLIVFSIMIGWQAIVDSNYLYLLPLIGVSVLSILMGYKIYPKKEYRWYKWGRE